MARYDLKDITAYQVGNAIVCPECIDGTEKLEATQEELFLRDDLEEKEDALFCDRCHVRIF